MLVSRANRHDSNFVEPILDSMPGLKRGGRGHPRRRPLKLHGDKGYDNPRVRLPAPPRHPRPHRPDWRRLQCPAGPASLVVERTSGWLLSYKRLALRYDCTALTITALARLAVTLICARRLLTN